MYGYSCGVWSRTADREDPLLLLGPYLNDVQGREFLQHPFQGPFRVTQGGPLFPKILNMVVDAVIWHWITLVMEEKAGLDGFDWVIQCLDTFVYANHVLDSSGDENPDETG